MNSEELILYRQMTEIHRPVYVRYTELQDPERDRTLFLGGRWTNNTVGSTPYPLTHVFLQERKLGWLRYDLQYVEPGRSRIVGILKMSDQVPIFPFFETVDYGYPESCDLSFCLRCSDHVRRPFRMKSLGEDLDVRRRAKYGGVYAGPIRVDE